MTYYSVDIINRNIKPSGEMKLLEKTDRISDEIQQFEHLRRELNQYTIKIKFSDIYDKPYDYEKDFSLIYCGKHRFNPTDNTSVGI